RTWCSAQLPALPSEPELRLTRKGDMFMLSSDTILQRCLARWWVNDKPVLLHAEYPERERATFTGTETSFRLEVDADALGARPGDTIGFQILCCPAGWVP